MTHLAALPILLAGLTAPADATEASYTCRVEGAWCVCETEHFAVWSRLPREETLHAAALCERTAAGLWGVWFDGSDRPVWPSRCVVALHADPAAYAAAVERPGTRTVGCTTLQVRDGRVTFRRIDLRCDRPNWRESALPHELTHVVLADRLEGRPLPLWADEGLAVLSEPEATREKRDEALLAAIRRGAVPSVRGLLRMESDPPAAFRDGFYGQSATLVSLLIERKSPAAFLGYLDRAAAVGDDAALRECYGLDGVAGLERLWQARKNAAAPGDLVEATGRAALAARMAGERLPAVTSRPPLR